MSVVWPSLRTASHARMAQLAYAALDVEVLVQLYGVFSKIQPELDLAPGGQ
jgi:ribonuclease D